MYLPTRIEKNIAWIDGRPWAFYRVVPYSYSPLSEQEKLSQWQSASRFFRQIQENDNHSQLWFVRRRFNWQKYLHDLAGSAPESYREAAHEVANRWHETISQGPILPDYDFIAAFEISLPLPHKYRWITQTFGIPTRQLERFLGYGSRVFREEKEEAERKIEDYSWIRHSFEERANSLSALEPLTESEIADFYRHHFFRGLSMRPLPDKLCKLWPRGDQDYVWLAEGYLEVSPHTIHIHQETGRRYLSFVSVGSFPDEVSLPGNELFFRAASELNFPVEGMIHWRHIPNKDAQTMARRKKQDVEDASSHVHQVEELPIDLLERREMAAGLEYEIKKNRPPLLESRILFCVDGENENEVSDRAESLIDFLDSYGFVAARPTGDQRQLFESWLPSPKWRGWGYKKILLPEVAAAITMPGASEILGDPNGIPVGFSRRGSVIKMDPARGPQLNQNASMAITGTLGSGKSFFLNTLIYYTALIWDARIFSVDPKGERSHWINQLPGIGDRVKILRLDGRDNPGALDPFRLTDDREAAAETAVSIIGLLLGNLSRQDELLLMKAAKVARTSRHPSMVQLLNALQEDVEGVELAEYLNQVAELPLGKLIFGEGDGPVIPDGGIILLQLAGLELPPEKQVAKTLRQKVSTAVMASTAILAESFILHGSGGFRVAALDEAWTWLRSDRGKALADRLERAGRSANAGIWFATQNPSDMPSEMLNNVGVYICLGTKDDRETEIAIEALGLQPTETLINELQERRVVSGEGHSSLSGVGYMRDLSGRAGWIQFYNPIPLLHQIFNTRPEAIEASKVFSKGGV